MSRLWIRSGVLVLALVACRDGDRSPVKADSETAVPAAVSPQSQPTKPAIDCPRTGKWSLCAVEKRLRRSGFVATKIDESPARAGFSVKPSVYKLGSGRIEIFLYEDSAALAKDLAGLDTLSVAPTGSAPSWPSPPALIRNGNLAAVYMDQTPRQAERLIMALLAGAPSG